MNRSAGILCPVFSIPANQGIGDLGQKTIRMCLITRQDNIRTFLGIIQS